MTMRIGLLLIGCMVGALPLAAQDVSAVKSPEYDVVSVRPSKDTSGNMMINLKPDGYAATGTTVKFMIMDAYGLKNQDLISGLPKWASETRYDVETKMDPEMIEAQKKLPPKERFEKHRVMVQALLADRFKLKVHEEEKEMPAYLLVPAKGGFKLKPLTETDPEKAGAKLPNGMHGGMLMYEHNKIEGQMVSIDSLAQNLGMNLHRQVIDKSGVTGNYDFTLRFTPEDEPADAASGAEAAPSLFTALEEQLGLRLESTKAKINTIVVDHVEMPGDNQ